MLRRLSFFLRIATPVSGLDLRRNGTSDLQGPSGDLARSSQKLGFVRRSIQIALALTTMTAASSCLITTDPTFEPPPRTAPFFEPDSAVPSNSRIFVVNSGVEEETFSALVQSEDAGSPLLARLYLDYGGPDNGDLVYFDSVASAEGLSPGSWDDTGRKVSVKWRASNFTMAVGCHRFTLMVVHDGFDEIGCPQEDGDYALMTWLVQKCATSDCSDQIEKEFNPGNCPPIDQQLVCPPRQGTPENTGGSQ